MASARLTAARSRPAASTNRPSPQAITPIVASVHDSSPASLVVTREDAPRTRSPTLCPAISPASWVRSGPADGGWGSARAWALWSSSPRRDRLSGLPLVWRAHRDCRIPRWPPCAAPLASVAGRPRDSGDRRAEPPLPHRAVRQTPTTGFRDEIRPETVGFRWHLHPGRCGRAWCRLAGRSVGVRAPEWLLRSAGVQVVGRSRGSRVVPSTTPTTAGSPSGPRGCCTE